MRQPVGFAGIMELRIGRVGSQLIAQSHSLPYRLRSIMRQPLVDLWSRRLLSDSEAFSIPFRLLPLALSLRSVSEAQSLYTLYTLYTLYPHSS